MVVIFPYCFQIFQKSQLCKILNVKGSIQLYFHEDRNSQNPNDPTGAVNCNGVNGVVDPSGNHDAGQELVGKSSNRSNDRGGPRGKHIASRTEGNHARYRAIYWADEGVFARDGFRDKETNNSPRATRHLWEKMIDPRKKSWTSRLRSLPPECWQPPWQLLLRHQHWLSSPGSRRWRQGNQSRGWGSRGRRREWSDPGSLQSLTTCQSWATF